MTNNLKRQTIYFASIASLILGCSLSMAPVALSKYRPPETPSAPKDTGSNATRGSCESNPTAGLTALAPLSHVGQTSTQHPTFVWFVPDRTPRPLQFHLYTSTGQPLYKTQMQSQSGITHFTLPRSQPELVIGQSYVWQVVLVCNPNVSSTNIVAAAKIQVVKPSPTLQTQLAAAQTPQQRSDLYAESGLWYDAVVEASKSPQSQFAVLDLLDSLASSEAQPLREWSDRLIQIQKIERQRQGQSQSPQPKL